MIVTKILDNGIKLVVEEMQHVNSVACGIWVKTGACDEDVKYSGISHFVEHMMFKGTPSRDAYHISYDIESMGAQINAFTGKEATCFYVKSLPESYKQACDIMCDMLEHSLFDKTELDRERHVIEEEIKMVHDDPEDTCHDVFSDSMFAGTSLGNSVTGTATSIRRVTHDVMRDYVDNEYTRDSICVSVAGKIDPEDAAKYFAGKFDKLKAAKPKRKIVAPSYGSFYKSIKRDINQAHLALGTSAMDMKDERSYAFMILNNILGGGMSSRLFQNIRERKGLCYTIYSGNTACAGGGFFEIYAGLNMDSVRKALLGIREELDRLGNDLVTDQELEASRAQMKASYFFSQESTSARMIVNGKNYLLIDKAFTPTEVIEGFDSVDKGSIAELAPMITDTRNYSAVIVSGKRMDVKAKMEAFK